MTYTITIDEQQDRLFRSEFPAPEELFKTVVMGAIQAAQNREADKMKPKAKLVEEKSITVTSSK